MVEYQTVAQEGAATLIEKKSKFLARVKPVQDVEEAEAFLGEIRKKHWNATHNVPAYIIGLKGEIQKFSDDNEPGGTAGLPVLEALKARQVVNVAAVVTRYFGGTLLGRGGLIRAYGGAARRALLKAGIVRMVPAVKVALTVDYVHSGKIQNELLTQGAALRDVEYLGQVTFYLLLALQEKERLRGLVRELTANEFVWQEGALTYLPRPPLGED